MAIAYIALGSNLGDRLPLLRRAVTRMMTLGRVTAASSVYETDPVGYTQQPLFLNAVVQLETDLAAPDLMTMLLGIELDMGRIRTVRHGPRSIDLDLLVYDDAVISTEHLTVPHPSLQERVFVLVPLAEIAPDYVHPVFQRTVRELLDDLGETTGIQRMGRLDGETTLTDDAVSGKEQER